MGRLDRRAVVAGIAAGLAQIAATPLMAQTVSQSPAEPAPHFGFEDVLKRARELGTGAVRGQSAAAARTLWASSTSMPGAISASAATRLCSAGRRAVPLEMFHLGHLYPRPVTINIVREGIATPVPYAASLFDYGRNKIDKPLPVNLGFAGFRLLYPLNRPDVLDEVAAFLGASYFRFLGRKQRYGMSARGLAVGAGAPGEEFPFFREFWIETPAPTPSV